MKKAYLWISLVLAAVLCLVFYNNSTSFSKEETYFYQINALIKDADFYTARVEEGKIVLYNAESEPICEMEFHDYDKSIKLIYVRKEGAVIHFITSGAVDDEQGIIFINDDSNRSLDGIKSLRRIGGNSYQYSTIK